MGRAFIYAVLTLSLALGLTIIVAVVLALLAFFGSVGTCGGDTRFVQVSPELSAAFQARWDSFNDDLNAGHPTSVTFSEGEVTSRGRTFLAEKDAPISDLKVCLNPGEGEATAKVDVPLFGSADVKVRGSVDLSGGTPQVTIHEIEVGNVPGFLADMAKDRIAEMINDQLRDLDIRHRYTVQIGAGRVQIDGEP